MYVWHCVSGKLHWVRVHYCVSGGQTVRQCVSHCPRREHRCRGTDAVPNINASLWLDRLNHVGVLETGTTLGIACLAILYYCTVPTWGFKG